MPYKLKWTPIILSLFQKQEIPNGFCKLSEYGIFKRGIATGANEFFALTKSQIEELKIAPNNLCKCITKSQLIRKLVFSDEDFNNLFNADKPVYCLDIKYPEQLEIIQYIKFGEESGYHQRYLTKQRNPWYRIEQRTPAPILFGVFNRGRLKVIRNFTDAINFTCYHAFYPNSIGNPFLEQIFVYLVSDLGQAIIKTNKRSYGNNLDKFEPGDLNNSYCPNVNQLALIDDEEARRFIEIARTNDNLAVQMSNNLVERMINQCFD